MNKKLWLSLLLLISSSVYANTKEMSCMQVLQAAVNQQGECQIFATPCEVPEDWRHVPSCDIIEDNEVGTSLETKMNKRKYLLRNKFKTQKIKNKEDSKKELRQVRRGIRRTRKRNKNIDTNESNRKIGKRRSFTEKNYSTASRNRVKYLNKRINGGLQQEGETTSDERKARRQGVHKIMSRVSTKRTGKLSNKPKWSTQVKYRKTAGIGVRRWNNHYTSEKRREDRNSRKKRVYEGIKLKKIWKGERIEGDF